MNPFDNYIKGALPHIKSAAAVACQYGDRIVTRLDLMLEEMAEEKWAQYHPRQSFTLVAGIAQDMNQIPTTEMWELEFISCTGGATITINEGADLFRYAKQFTNADAQQGLGLMFGGGTAPTIVCSGGNTLVTVQFKRRKMMPARPSNAAGLVEAPDLFNGQPLGERGNDGRHSTLVGYTSNIQGENARNGKMP